MRPPRLVAPIHITGPARAGEKPRRKVLELTGMSPSEVAREERPAGALACALEGHAIVFLEVANLVDLARDCRNALSAQCQRQVPREIMAGISLRTVNDQNPCPWHCAFLNAQGCEDRAGESRHGPGTRRAIAAIST